MKFDTIKARIQAIILVMFLLSILNAGMVFMVLQKNAGDAQYINLAGRQRMLVQKMTKEILSKDFASARNTANLFENSLQILKNGDRNKGLEPITDPKILAAWEDLHSCWQDFKKAFDHYLITGNKTDLNYLLDHNLKILSLANTLTKKFEEKAISNLNRLKIYQIAILSFTMFLLAAIWWMARTKIIAPIDKAVALVMRVAEGDFTVKFPKTSKDEIGRLLAALEEMTERLRETLRNVVTSSDQVYSSSQEIYRAGEEVAEKAVRLAQEGEEVKEAEKAINNSVRAVSAASEQMVEAITEISRNTSEAARIASEAETKAKETNDIVNKLGVSSEEIGEVISLIQSIAEQTNLLALNATIEAARAGEAGKGFAVVAGEVKELSRQTTKATEKISRKIQAIQTDARASVKAIQEITEVISRINDISNMIASAVEEQTAMMGEISQAANMSAESAEQIREKIEKMSRAIKDTAEKGNKSRELSQEMIALANRLKELASNFKV
ncbi:methyl-accepting chemotaxis protein [Thermodesulfatator indicus]